MSSPHTALLTDVARARPDSLAEAVDAVRTGGTLLVRGGGTKLDWGPPPDRIDTVLDTGGLARIIRHDPADAVAVLEPGVRLAELAEALSPHHQELGVDDPGLVDGATVGGAVAAAVDGPRRLRRGPVRGVVLGLTVVLADGTVARAGGTVIKNVAGYDLMRLMTGSLGTLALIARVAVRLHPRPPARVTLAIEAGEHDVNLAVRALLASRVEPSAVVWSSRDSRLLVALEGREEGLAPRRAQTADLLADAGLVATTIVDDAEWDRLAREHRQALGQTVARAACAPTQLPAVARALREAAAGAGVKAELTSLAVLGLHDAVISGGQAGGHAACVRSWRRALAPLRASVVVRRRSDGLDDPEGVWDADTVWGEPSPAVALMRAIKHALDPDGRFVPGRHVGGI